MTSDEQIRSFFGEAAPHVAHLRAQYRAGWPKSLAGGSIGCLIPMTILVVLIVQFDAWSKHAWFRPAAVGGAVAAIACALAGIQIYKRGQAAFEPVDARANDALIRPLAELLVEDAGLEFPDDSILEWRGSLLFPREAHVFVMHGKTNRVTGRIAGLPAVLDEMVIRFRSSPNRIDRTFDGWVVRLELPFAVGGHLRVRVRKGGYEGRMIQDGFAFLEAEQARLGTDHLVDAAPPGEVLEWADAPAPAGLAPGAVLTTALADALRAHPQLEIAVSGRTLWILSSGPRAFDCRAAIGRFHAEFGLETAARLRAVEDVARAVVSSAR